MDKQNIKSEYDTQLELELMTGFPVTIYFEQGNRQTYIRVKSYTIRDMLDIGYVNYQSHLSSILFNPEKSRDKIKKELRQFCVYDNAFEFFEAMKGDGLLSLMQSVSFFLVDEFQIRERNGRFYITQVKEEKGEQLIVPNNITYIDAEVFKKIKEILEIQHGYTELEKKKKENKKVSELRKKYERLKKEAERRSKKKRGASDGDGDDSEKIYLPQLIEIASRKANGTNLLEIPNLTIYQLNKVFRGAQIVTTYEQQNLALSRGAEIKASDLIHWTKK